MKNSSLKYLFAILLTSFVALTGCNDSGTNDDDGPTVTDFTDLLTNQVNEVIVPSAKAYQSAMDALVIAADEFIASGDAISLTSLRAAHNSAYLAYQAIAVHNYFATANQSLVLTTNLYPVDVDLLEDFIANERYDFNTSAQQRANGFPAIDYMLYGPSDVLAYFAEDDKRGAFLTNLVSSMKDRADILVTQWTGSLQAAFVENGGTALGSSVSTQLNESLVYYEDHIRENKVGIPIGQLGPLDTPIDPDGTKIEAYYQSLVDGDDRFPLSLVRASLEEMEDLYLGSTSGGADGQGYDDLLIARDQSTIDDDIKAQFATIYSQISNRTTIAGDNSLYDAVQELVTLYKSDFFPVLNIQDADGLNDGD
ncbi:MAG: imelysin family protein [Bacteroidota bacterium]